MTLKAYAVRWMTTDGQKGGLMETGALTRKEAAKQTIRTICYAWPNYKRSDIIILDYEEYTVHTGDRF